MIFLGHKLKNLRAAKGLSMRDLCKLSGVADAYISQIETGKRNPGPEVVKKLSEALKIDQIYFYLEESHRWQGFFSAKKKPGTDPRLIFY